MIARIKVLKYTRLKREREIDDGELSYLSYTDNHGIMTKYIP